MAQKEDLLVEGRTLREELGESRGEVTCQDKVINWGRTQGEPWMPGWVVWTLRCKFFEQGESNLWGKTGNLGYCWKAVIPHKEMRVWTLGQMWELEAKVWTRTISNVAAFLSFVFLMPMASPLPYLFSKFFSYWLLRATNFYWPRALTSSSHPLNRCLVMPPGPPLDQTVWKEAFAGK